MLSNDVLKQILGRRDVEEKRGWAGEFISQATFDLELHANNDPATRFPNKAERKTEALKTNSVLGPGDIDYLPSQRAIHSFGKDDRTELQQFPFGGADKLEKVFSDFIHPAIVRTTAQGGGMLAPGHQLDFVLISAF